MSIFLDAQPFLYAFSLVHLLNVFSHFCEVIGEFQTWFLKQLY